MTNTKRCVILFILIGICLLPFFVGNFDIKGFKPSKDVYPVVKHFADRILKGTDITPHEKEKEFTKASFEKDRASNVVVEQEKEAQLSTIDNAVNDILKIDDNPNFQVEKKAKKSKIKTTLKAKLKKEESSNNQGKNTMKNEKPELKSTLKAILKSNDATTRSKKDKISKFKSTVKAILSKDRISNTFKDSHIKSILKSKLKNDTLNNLARKVKGTVKAIKKIMELSILKQNKNRGLKNQKMKLNLPLKKSIQIITMISKKNITFEYTILPIGVNKAKIIQEKYCTQKDPALDRKPNKLILVTNYIPIDLSRDEYFIYGRHITKDEEEARIYEILSTYQKNLNNPSIAKLYIFVEHSESVQFLKNTAFENSSKLVIVRAEKGFTTHSIFSYISKCLRDRVVVYTNMDIVIGEGFEKINTTLLKERKLMYALTRYSKHDYTVGTCTNSRYDMSHDTFIFHVRTMTKDDLKSMEVVKGNEFGMESLIMHLFRHKLGYKVINPCKVLFTYHEHQVHMRKKKSRLRVEEHHNEVAGITNKLMRKK